MDICTENSFIQNSFGVHMMWIISVLSLMPKGEIVGIKLVFPLVTTLSNIQCLPGNTVSTELRVMQCLPSYAMSTGLCSVYRVLQCSQSTVRSAVFTEYSSEYSVHRV